MPEAFANGGNRRRGHLGRVRDRLRDLDAGVGWPPSCRASTAPPSRRAGGAVAVAALAGATAAGRHRASPARPGNPAVGACRGDRRPHHPGSGAYRAAQREIAAVLACALAILRARSVGRARGRGWCARYDGVKIAARSAARLRRLLDGAGRPDRRPRAPRRHPGGARRRRCRWGAGNRLIDMCSALASRGLTVPGVVSDGRGGRPRAGRRRGPGGRALGTTSDNVRSLTIVTANGQALTANARQNADLYWACRGGGGNFGIVTGFTFTTHAVSTASYASRASPGRDVGDVVARLAALGPENAPPGSSPLLARHGSGRPRPRTSSASTWARRARSGRCSAGSPPRPAAQPAGRHLAVHGPDPALGRLLSESPAECRRPTAFAAKSSYVLSPMSGRGIATMASWIERRQQSSLGSGAIIDSYGGAINSVPAGATAFVPRRPLLVPVRRVLGRRRQAAQSAALSWIRGFYAAMRPFVSRFAYQNYHSTPTSPPGRTPCYGSDTTAWST